MRAGLLMLALLVGGCTPWPAAGCELFVDAYATRLVECRVYRSREVAEAAVLASFTEHPAGCGATTDILEPSLWFDECIPRMAKRACDELYTLPNACGGQLVLEPPPDRPPEP